MKAKSLLGVLALLILTMASCSKQEEEKYCWQIIDSLGNSMNIVCDKTENEMRAAYPNRCSYYKLANESCWYVNNGTFIVYRE
jgi:hypothetical protein